MVFWNRKRGYPILKSLKAERSWQYLREMHGGRLQIEQVNGEVSRRLPFVVAVAPDEVRFIPLRRNVDPFQFYPSAIRWYGRPHKYEPGINEMWIHIEMDERWYRLRLRLYQSQMQRWVREMKSITSDELVTAYRRHRPYVHYGPVMASPAEQDIYGAWTLAPPLSLYLTPLQLVALDGPCILRTFPVQQMQSIRAGGRLDAPEADGLVSFTVSGERIAFSLPEYQHMAQMLGEAAKRSLEEPVRAKSKKQDE